MSDHPEASSGHEAPSTVVAAPTTTPTADAMASLIQATLTPIIGPLVAEQAALRQMVERQADTIADLREERGRESAEAGARRRHHRHAECCAGGPYSPANRGAGPRADRQAVTPVAALVGDPGGCRRSARARRGAAGVAEVMTDLMDAVGFAVVVVCAVLLAFVLWWRSGSHKGEPPE